MMAREGSWAQCAPLKSPMATKYCHQQSESENSGLWSTCCWTKTLGNTFKVCHPSLLTTFGMYCKYKCKQTNSAVKVNHSSSNTLAKASRTQVRVYGNRILATTPQSTEGREVTPEHCGSLCAFRYLLAFVIWIKTRYLHNYIHRIYRVPLMPQTPDV